MAHAGISEALRSAGARFQAFRGRGGSTDEENYPFSLEKPIPNGTAVLICALKRAPGAEPSKSAPNRLLQNGPGGPVVTVPG